MLRYKSLIAFVFGLSLAGIALSQSTLPQTATTLGQNRPTTPTPPPLAKANSEGATFLQRGVAAIAGQMLASDITLAGNITVFRPGGVTESGTITLIAKGDSQAEIVMKLGSGTRTEVRSVSSDGVPAEMLIAADGTVKHNPARSLFTPHPAWFLPTFSMTQQPLSNTASSFVASETRAGTPVNHLQVWQLSEKGTASALPSSAVQQDTQYDVYLDPATSLPIAVVYWIQPDYPKQPAVVYVHRDTRAPVEIRFQDYRNIQGIPVAFHIQTFVQGRQNYDIQLSSATLNTVSTIPSVN